MKMLRPYAIRTKLSLVFLLMTVLMILNGALSVYFSKGHLSSVRIFVDNTVPKIQRTNDLQQTASMVKGYARELFQTTTRGDLELLYTDLTGVLTRMEHLTAAISGNDSGIDIVSLNFLSQAIRSQAQLVFQLKAGLFEKSAKEQELIKGLRRYLMGLFVLESKPAAMRSAENHEPMQNLQNRLMWLMEELDMLISTPKGIDRLRSELKAVRADMTHSLQMSPVSGAGDEARHLTKEMAVQAEQLFDMMHQSMMLSNRIDGFVRDLNDQAHRLNRLTNQYIDGFRGQMQKDTETLLSWEERTISLILWGLCIAMAVLFLVHRQVVVRGFGNRLSMISRAMGRGATGHQALDLPLKGRDEIADMAKAADNLIKKAQKLNTLATMDELTGLYNRRRFFQLAEKESERAARTAKPAVLLMLDIDHFKMINDTWGHDFGDRALHEFARACSRVIRKMDLFARYGGEEFVLLMPETAPEQGRAAAERLLDTVADLELATDSGHKVGMTVSIGLAETYLGFHGVNQLIKQADSALYLAKKLGRNRVESYNGL